MFDWASRLTSSPASTVAPVQYLEIPVAAILGWFVFEEFPNGLALLGMFVILAAGLYILRREQVINQTRRAAKVPTPLAQE